MTDVSARDDPLAWAAAQPADPVRRRVLQALARRAAAQPHGALREQLVARLQRRAGVPAPSEPSEPSEPSTPALRSAPAAGPLAALLARLQSDAGPELRQVRAHAQTWSQLRVDRRLAEVAAPVPEHLGPLNSQVLVARALQQLQQLAPGYLQRLLAQLDGLAALAPLQQPDKPADKPARATRPARAGGRTAQAARRR